MDTGDNLVTYDKAGHAIETVDNIGDKIYTQYDPLGRPTATWLSAIGTGGTQLTADTYDTATGGLGMAASSTSYVNGDTANGYTTTINSYDKNGNTTSSTVTLPASEGILHNQSYTTTSSYNSAGQVTAVRYPQVGTGTDTMASETVATTYTALGLISSVASNAFGSPSYVSSQAYSNIGQLVGRTYGTGTITASRGYSWNDVSGALDEITTSITASGHQSTAQDDLYRYDNDGNVTMISSVDQSQCFSYDSLNRLTAAYTNAPPTGQTTNPPGDIGKCANGADSSGTAPYNLAYQYDDLGNVTNVSNITTGAQSAYSYTPTSSGANGLSNGPHAVNTVTHTGGISGTDTYGYSTSVMQGGHSIQILRDGDMTTSTVAGVTTNYTWAQRQLASASTVGGTTNYIYDAGGNLLLRKSPAETVLYLAGQELHLTGTVVAPTRFYNSGGSTVGQRAADGTTNGALTWLTADSQGSAQLAINANTGAYNQQRYLPFGAQRGTQGPPSGSNRSFLGHDADPTTGLLQDGARFYNTNLGRFISPDPIVIPTEPQDLNAYSYGINNPETFSDPSGLIQTGRTDGGGGTDDNYHCGDPQYTGSCPSSSGGVPGPGGTDPSGPSRYDYTTSSPARVRYVDGRRWIGRGVGGVSVGVGTCGT
jgi:RHS repeat-associated protein